jgi:hypothetical protein
MRRQRACGGENRFWPTISSSRLSPRQFKKGSLQAGGAAEIRSSQARAQLLVGTSQPRRSRRAGQPCIHPSAAINILYWLFRQLQIDGSPSILQREPIQAGNIAHFTIG